MAIVQEASGTFNGATFTATLPGAVSSSNTVAVIVAGNTTVTTPGSWTLRTSQVNQMGHYLYDRTGTTSLSQAFACATGQGTWYAVELSGAYDTSTSANDTTGNTVYATPTLTPTAGARTLLASLGSLFSSARTVSGWTNSFVEEADVCQASADFPMQGVASLSVTANGSTGYSTTATYSATSTGRSAIIASYTDTAAAVATYVPITLRAAGATPATGALVTAISPVVPAGATTGDLSVLCVEAKPYTTTITTPSGWTKIGEVTNGTTASAADVGAMKTAMYVRESATPGAIGNMTFTGADSAMAVIHTYAKSAAYAWDFSAFTTGSQASTSNVANYSATGGVLPVAPEDWVIAATGANTDLVAGFTAQAINGLTGATLTKSVRTTGATSTAGLTTTGNDSKLIVTDAWVTAGQSATAPTFTYTSTSASSGSTMWLRLRQVLKTPPWTNAPRQARRRAANW